MEHINKTLIIGLGLIGGSFAKALKKYDISKEIYACDLDEESIMLAKESGVIKGVKNLNEDISEFDLIAIATPLSTYLAIFKQIENKISAHTTVIDLGSVKEFAAKSSPKNLKNNLILGHPIAGSDQVGFANAEGDLFLNRKFIICPENSDKIKLKKVENLVKKIGGKVEFLEAKKHDEIYALVSHLPQFLSFWSKEFSPQKIAEDSKNNRLQLAFRLDNSSPEIWSDIFKFNQENLEKFYLEFFDNLEKFEQKISEKKFAAIIQDISAEAELKNETEFSDEFLKNNFAEVFLRILIVASYLRIAKIKEFQSFAGQGFKDFTSIISAINFEEKELISLLEKNQQKISKLFTKLLS